MRAGKRSEAGRARGAGLGGNTEGAAEENLEEQRDLEAEQLLLA